MKIAFFAPMKPPHDPVPSGEGRMANLFLDALQRAGFEVEIASSLRLYEGRGDAERQKRLAEEGGAEARRLLARYRALPMDERPVLWFTYHLYHKAPDHLGPAVAVGLGIPYVVAEASHAPKQARGAWAEGFAAAARAIGAASRIYCLNANDRPCLERVARPDALLDLPPFIDTAPFRPSEAGQRTALVRRYGLDSSAPIILVVAMMRADQKLLSYRVLADALSRLEGEAWSALVVGDGPAEGEVRALMAPLRSRIAFAGRLEGGDLLDAYAGADIYAWPSVKEAFGLTFIEASASGLAVVAGRSGGIDAIVENGQTGLVVPAGDAPALAEALRALLRDPPRRRAMGRAGAERASRVNDVAAAALLLREDLIHLVGRQDGKATDA